MKRPLTLATRFFAGCVVCAGLVSCSERSGGPGSAEWTNAPDAAPRVEIAAPTLKNVVLIAVDGLRADHVGAYGYAAPTTPNIDQFAQESMVIDAWATSSFGPQSVSSVMTGRYPTRAGAIGFLEAHPSEEAETLAETLRRAQVETGLVANQPFLSRRGFTRGFYDVQISRAEQLWSAPEVTDRALEFMDLGEGKPFLLYTQYSNPLIPYRAPKPYTDKFPVSAAPLDVDAFARTSDPNVSPDDPEVKALVARYDAEVAYVDEAIGVLLQGLEERGLLDESLVVIFGTHGQEFLEHGYVANGWTLYREVLHVPLIMRFPGVTPGRLSDVASVADLFPTVLSTLNIEYDASTFDGLSLLRRAAGRGTFEIQHRPLISELVIPERTILRSVLNENMLHIVKQTAPPVADRHVVAAGYDSIAFAMSSGQREKPPIWSEPISQETIMLAPDPQTGENAFILRPEVLGPAVEALNTYRTKTETDGFEPHVIRHREPLPDPENLEMLESLGYL